MDMKNKVASENKIANIVVLGGLALVCGCDFFGSQAKKVEMLKLEQQQAERVSSERKDQSNALRVYIEGRCQIVKEEYEKVASRLKVLKADIDNFEKAVAAAFESDGAETPSHEVRLLRLLKAPAVDALARKYLASGFAAQCGMFVARIRDVRAQRENYEAALRKCDAEFDAKLGQIGDWTSSNKARNSTETTRLRQEIHDLENRLSSLRKALRGSKSAEKERAEKIREVEYQLRTKRMRLDALLTPETGLHLETRAANAHQQAFNDARTARNNERKEIDRRLKPKLSETDVACEIEAQTLGLLRKEMQKLITGLTERAGQLEKKMRQAREMQLEASICEGDELKRLRSRVDAALTLEPSK